MLEPRQRLQKEKQTLLPAALRLPSVISLLLDQRTEIPLLQTRNEPNDPRSCEAFQGLPLVCTLMHTFFLIIH